MPKKISSELSSASADYLSENVSYAAPPPTFVDTDELDTDWLSAQVGASLGCSHRIVRHLASGGMGHVFVAEHVYLGAHAAVKVPRYADATGRMILEAEAKLLAKLEHPNIVRALDVGHLADGRVYLLMEHATGIELGAWLDACGAMPFERCVSVLRQIASALDYLHLKGIVHGDIKPANILIDPGASDFVKLVDFGIASSSAREERRGVLGTPAYMAPEQARGEAWGPHSDVYAVAALALQMLTGHPPHEYCTAQDVLTAVLTEPASRPSALGLKVPGLDAVFEKGLNRDPAQRFGRASAFVSALADVLSSAAPRTAAASATPNLAVAAPLPLALSLSSASNPWGLMWSERVWRRLAACVVAAVFVFSVYG